MVKVLAMSAGTITEINVATGGTVATTTVSVPFTDGDTYRRVTITDANVLSTSSIICSVRRPDTANDSVDLGYMYSTTVLRVATGSFDVGISCKAWGMDDPTGLPPNETISLVYLIG